MKKRKKEKINYKEIWFNLKRTWKFTKPYRGKLIFYIILSIIVTLIGIAIPLISAKILINITNGIFDKLIIFSFAYFLIQLISSIMRNIASKISEYIYLSSSLDIQIAITSELLDLETKELDKNSVGVFVERLKGDSGSLASIFEKLLSSASDLFGNIGILVAIFIINKYMFLYFILSIVIVWLLEQERIKKYYKVDSRYRKYNEGNTGLATELVRGIRDIKVLNIKQSFLNKVSNDTKKIFNERFEMNKIARLYRTLIFCVEDFMEFLFIILGIILITTNNLTIEDFIILYMYNGKVQGLISYFSYELDSLKEFNLSAKRVFDILDNDAYKKEKFGKIKLNKVNGEFEFKKVNFSYGNKKKVLNNMSFKIMPNQTVAFVGKSGVGKTTIFSIIDKLYNINSGSILIDGVNINDLDQESIRNNISIITQDPYIFNFSIKENLKIVKPNATQKEIKEACKIACLDDYIEKLPHKYNTVIGENGVMLSGGQKQRLAIARALLRKTEIILFDEATSSLDNETQQLIQQAINNMQGEYTILIIAHRLSTIVNADRILVVDDGKIVAEGTHQELMKHNKLYKHLYETEIK